MDRKPHLFLNAAGHKKATIAAQTRRYLPTKSTFLYNLCRFFMDIPYLLFDYWPPLGWSFYDDGGRFFGYKCVPCTIVRFCVRYIQRAVPMVSTIIALPPTDAAHAKVYHMKRACLLLLSTGIKMQVAHKGKHMLKLEDSKQSNIYSPQLAGDTFKSFPTSYLHRLSV